MIGLLTGIIGTVAKQVLIATFSHNVMKIVVIGLLEKLVKSTKNTLDDAIVEQVKRNLEKAGDEHERVE